MVHHLQLLPKKAQKIILSPDLRQDLRTVGQTTVHSPGK
ncbi:hypothetical protein MTR67_026873 [Solanum verrucosum]|uniref:Uncharacterized protein n=1 Tax=Solanum verrucosum TaxID=315347 RepID=A0AAF0TZX7_SOLVR|nr:hypothetical protein MTR67_026873 [Solanum verrucosum]